MVILCCWHNLRFELLIDKYVLLQLFRMQVLENQSHAVLTLTKWNHLSFVLLILLLPQLVLHHLNFLVILILLLFQLDDLPEQAFYMVGTIDEAIEKAASLAG